MSFKFNFSNSGNDDTAKYGENEADLPLEQAVEISVKRKCLEDDDVAEVTLQDLTLEDGTRMYYIFSQLAEQRVREACGNSRLTHALRDNTDLLPNVYEGGLKVWECSVDLANHLTSLNIAFRGLKVLELGCGAGLPGLYAFLKGARTHFQDYNREVLDYITIPNVHHNSVLSEPGTAATHPDSPQPASPQPASPQPASPHTAPLDPDKCRFFAGDWELVKQLLLPEIKTDDEKYDMILTSETIYCPDNYKKLHETMATLLNPKGVVYLSAKTYYFGVGGGLREFETKVNEWGVFDIKCRRQFTEGVQREIMELQFKKKM